MASPQTGIFALGTAAHAYLEFDVLLSDLMMPGKDGIEVLKRARLINETTIVLVMTAHGTVEGAVEAMQVGAVPKNQLVMALDGVLA